MGTRDFASQKSGKCTSEILETLFVFKANFKMQMVPHVDPVQYLDQVFLGVLFEKGSDLFFVKIKREFALLSIVLGLPKN